VPFTARVGRAHSDRARSASKKDGLAVPLPSLFDSLQTFCYAPRRFLGLL